MSFKTISLEEYKKLSKNKNKNVRYNFSNSRKS